MVGHVTDNNPRVCVLYGMCAGSFIFMAPELKTLYSRGLTRYIRGGGERPLHVAYELGRRSIKENRSILDMVNLHHAALAEIRERDLKGKLPNEGLTKAGEFL